MKLSTFVITFVAAILLGLNAGFFYTWSFTIMQALNVISAEHAIDAMQSINQHVRNGWFAVVFFGAPAMCLAALILQLIERQWQAVAWAALSCAAIATTVVITAVYHLPWNEALAGVVLSGANQDAGGIWSNYSMQWTTANHGRTAASFVAFIAMICALIRRD